MIISHDSDSATYYCLNFTYVLVFVNLNSVLVFVKMEQFPYKKSKENEFIIISRWLDRGLSPKLQVVKI